ncbi:MAG: multiheme c-type cytochrome [Bacteroidota bacterium]
MKNLSKFTVGLFLLSGIFIACNTETEDPDPTPELAFVGSENCQTCHSEKYTSWIGSGHPYKFSVISDGTAPEYPAEAINFQSTWLTGLGDGSHTWDDIAGVIGGYGWKARFVGTDGHIIGTAGSSFSTGAGHNQINFFGGVNLGWVDYEKTNDAKLYNYGCFKCHTTGGTQDGTWLTGVDGLGSFTEGGIGCESCHGPGSIHADDPKTDNIDRVYEFAHLDNTSGGLTIDGTVITPSESGDDINFLCGTCHNRGYTNLIDSKGGFIKHHEQWDELVSGVHSTLNCTDCHNPHKRTIWNGDGLVKNCTDCHSTVATTNHSTGATCVDCHMPYAAKSGTTIGDSGYEGDIRSHLMKIAVSGESIFTADGSAVIDNGTDDPALNVAFACLGCHNRSSTDNITDKTIEQALASAAAMHQ